MYTLFIHFEILTDSSLFKCVKGMKCLEDRVEIFQIFLNHSSSTLGKALKQNSYRNFF